MSTIPNRELLNALKGLVLWVETFERGECTKAELQSELHHAKATITKAEGVAEMNKTLEGSYAIFGGKHRKSPIP